MKKFYTISAYPDVILYNDTEGEYGYLSFSRNKLGLGVNNRLVENDYRKRQHTDSIDITIGSLFTILFRSPLDMSKHKEFINECFQYVIK